MFRHRSISGIVMGVSLVLAINLLPPVGTLLVLLVLTALVQNEFYVMLSKAGIRTFRIVGLIAGAVMITSTLLTTGPEPGERLLACVMEQFVVFTCIAAVFTVQAFNKDRAQAIRSISCTILGVMYVPFLMNFFTKLCYGWESACHEWYGFVCDTGRLLVIYAVLVVKVTDTFAYIVGSKIGKHKVFPVISPGKTWEGLAGGVFMAVVSSVSFQVACKGKIGELYMGLDDAVILGFLLAIAGIAGDLFESLIKRSVESKDSGASVPGMGGFLDVLDSLLFGVPVVYFYAQVFLK